MSSDSNSPNHPSSSGQRRSSIAGQFVDLFGTRPSTFGTPAPGVQAGPIAAAAVQAQQRRLSLTTVGLSGSANQASPYGSLRARADSISSSNSGTVEESPFEDGDAPMPSSPFARRMSFSARAMQNLRSPNGSGSVNGRSSISTAKSPPAANHSRGHGYDFAENVRTRAERSSVSGISGIPQAAPIHQRARSVAMEEAPVKELPKQPRRPDAFQERILKGDFYMD